LTPDQSPCPNAGKAGGPKGRVRECASAIKVDLETHPLG
jgi:hypothetical protein